MFLSHHVRHARELCLPGARTMTDTDNPITWLSEEIAFPPPEEAQEFGLLAVGGDLSPERLLLAYANGIFPWPHEGMPLLWFAPDPRCVFLTDRIHVSRSLRAKLRRGVFEVRLDTAFREVVEACATVSRGHENGTWISPEIVEGYCELHRLGYAHSAESWLDGELVGGLYGVSLGGMFMGESMFVRVSDASKVAFVTLVRQLERWGIGLVDGQIPNPYLASLGGIEWPRSRYLEALRKALEKPTRKGLWRLDAD
jgi:leucyl/phenylalanyl-tRNA---protein transferase